MKKWFITALLTAGAMSAVTDNVVSNADFTPGRAKAPKHWELRGKNAGCSAADGVLTLADGLLVQGGLKLTPGTTYDFTYSVQGTSGKTRGYVEWHFYKNGKVVSSRTIGGAFKAVTGDWQPNTRTFTYSSGASAPYLVLQAQGGTAQFKDVSITPRQQYRALGGYWVLKDAATADNDGAITIPGRTEAGIVAVPMVRGKRYELSFDAIGIGASEQISGYHAFKIRTHFAKLPNYFTSEILEVYSAGTQNKTVTFTVPDDAAFGDSGSFSFMVMGKSKIKFSNLKLTEAAIPLTAKYPLIVTSPAFRNAIYASRPIREITGEIPFDADIRTATLSFDGQSVPLKRDGAKYTFTIPATDLSDGEHPLAATLTAVDGSVIQRRECIRKFPAAPREVVSEHNRIYVDGKPFFPIVMFYVYSESAMKYLASRGFNTGIATFERPTETQLLSVLNHAAASGFQMFLMMNLPSGGKPDTAYARWHRAVEAALTRQVREHPALLGWYLADEPAWGGVAFAQLNKAYEKLRDLDPYHPVWICEAPRGVPETHERYAQASDIFGIDVYPVPYLTGIMDHRPDTVAGFTQFARQAVHGRKPLIMVLQGFSWKDMTHQPNPVYPTREELNHAVLSALINGVNGLAFYGHNHVYRPEFYDTFFAVTDTLNRMLPFFTADGSCTALPGGGNNVDLYRLRQKNSTVYVALNGSDLKQTVGLALPDVPDGSYAVISEARRITVQNGKIRDAFAPGSAHIYAITALPEPYRQTPAAIGENPYAATAAQRAAKRAAKKQ